ncbi:hypothetical protein C8R42DRAFT_648169 [Lentinula raphanica]|nr:hypothetical protein C8R42DRAFT_648169 [Lentinula raphanica]
MLFMPSHLIALSCLFTTFLSTAAMPLSGIPKSDLQLPPAGSPAEQAPVPTAQECVPPGHRYEKQDDRRVPVELYTLVKTRHKILRIGDYYINAQIEPLNAPKTKDTTLVPKMFSKDDPPPKDAPKLDRVKVLADKEKAECVPLGSLNLQGTQTDQTVVKGLLDTTAITKPALEEDCVDYVREVARKLSTYDRSFNLPQNFEQMMKDAKVQSKASWEKAINESTAKTGGVN